MNTEADTCRKYVVPKLLALGWDSEPHSIAEQRTVTDGRVIPVGKEGFVRKTPKRVDFLLRYNRDFPLAVVEAKATYKTAADAVQQARSYAEMLGLKFAYATNGTDIIEIDYFTGTETLVLDFPMPGELWKRYQTGSGITSPKQADQLIAAYNLIGGKPPRYYQQIAINRTVEAILAGKRRLLLTMATGTGKTTTLQLLATSSAQRGLYLAFNRSIAEDARSRFPNHVACATSHSIAFRGVRVRLGYPEWKLTGALNPGALITSFTMPETITFQSGLSLPKRSYCSVLLDAVKRFLQSDAVEPTREHLRRVGCLLALTDNQFADFTQQAIVHVHAVWNAMRHKDSGLPLGHDGYLKLWALSQPRANVDYIMVGEAQDLNPVILGVLRSMRCPIVYVGDPYQQIYEWRGAVNAMDQVPSQHRVLLSQSFRFGEAIARAATTVIRSIGATKPLRGLATLPSDLSPVRPDVILARSNTGVIGSVLQCLQRGVSCHVLGGTRELERLLEDVKRVKQGATAQSSELLGFTTWKDVMSFSAQGEGEYLRGLVSLVQEYGEDTMLRAIARCEPEETSARVVCSTAHKAKGREWNFVRVDPDFDAALIRASKAKHAPDRDGGHNNSFEAEARLLYVAMTRAKRAVHLPKGVMSLFTLQSTNIEVLGSEVVTLPKDASDFASKSDSSGVVSPYHSPRTGESREMATLRRLLG